MEEFWVLILVLFFATNSLEKAESVKVKLEETPLKTFDEIFGEGWWDKDEAADDLKMPPTNFGQNVHHQIDRQNAQLGQIKPNSTDQNPPLTESRRNPKNERKKLVVKFDQMKAELKRAGLKNSYKHEIDKTVAKELGLSFTTIYNWKRELGQTMTNYSDDEKLKIVKELMRMKSAPHSGEDKKSCKEIDKEIAERFGVNVRTINQWKKEFGLSQRNPKNERKNLVEKFVQRKAELKRDGFKSSYKSELDETVAKELGLSDRTIYRWKRKLGQSKSTHKYSHIEQKELIRRYYEIKGKINPKISDEDIAKRFKTATSTLYIWKKQFKRQQFHTNSVDEQSVEVNAGSNFQEIGNSNLGSI